MPRFKGARMADASFAAVGKIRRYHSSFEETVRLFDPDELD
jgi:hypothetical protein